MAKWSRWVQIWQIYTPVLISCGQNEYKFGRSTPTSASRCTPQYWHFMVKMSSNLADLSIDVLADLLPSTDILWSRWVQIWQIYPPFIPRAPEIPTSKFSGVLNTMAKWSRWVQIWQIYTPVLISCGQNEYKFGRSTPRSASRCTPQYLHPHGQDEFKFGRSIHRCAGRSPPQYWHLVVKMSSRSAGRSTPQDSFLELQKSLLGQVEFKFGRCWTLDLLADLSPAWHQDEFKFGRSTPRSGSRCIPLLTSGGQEWQFQVSIVTADISRSTGRSTPSTDILWSRWPFHF